MHEISVVMACYNGEKEVESILDSLKAQTCFPDEILIVDDCSTDRTTSIILDYVERHGLTKWCLTENERNLGWKRNFMQGMIQAKGDLIFLCDQDDLWDPEKIAKMKAVMDQIPQIDVLACDYEVQYGAGSIPMRRYRKKKTERTGETAQYQFSSRFFQNASPGCTYVVRKTFLDRVKAYWFPEAPHDEFLWLMATMEDGAWFLNQRLMILRRGNNNASDIKYKDIAMQQENLKYISEMLGKMEQYAANHQEIIQPEKTAHLKKAQVWCRKRQQLMEKRNPLLWIGMFPYWKYYNSFRNCLSDLYLVLFGSFTR